MRLGRADARLAAPAASRSLELPREKKEEGERRAGEKKTREESGERREKREGEKRGG